MFLSIDQESINGKLKSKVNLFEETIVLKKFLFQFMILFKIEKSVSEMKNNLT